MNEPDQIPFSSGTSSIIFSSYGFQQQHEWYDTSLSGSIGHPFSLMHIPPSKGTTNENKYWKILLKKENEYW